MAQRSVTPFNFHFDGVSVSEFKFTLNIKYLSVLLAYLYTVQLYTDLSSPGFFLFMAVTCNNGRGEKIYRGLEAYNEFFDHLAPYR